MYTDVIMSTTDSIKGYVIVEHKGIVHGNVTHKSDLFSRSTSRENGSWNMVLYSSMEMSKTDELINESWELAYQRICKSATNKGANAVIGVRTDNNIENELIHISVYGTAVRIITENEYERYIESKLKEEADKKQKETAVRLAVEKKRERRNTGDFFREEQFLKDIMSLDSMIKIWELWNDSGLNNEYKDLDILISTEKNSERMYGKIPGDTERLKEMIQKRMLEK